MNYDDLKNKYNKKLDILVDQTKTSKNHQDIHKSDFTLKHTNLKEDYFNIVKNYDDEITKINHEIKNNLLEHSNSIKQRFETYNNEIAEYDFEKKLADLTSQFNKNKEEQLKIINQSDKKTRQENTYKINAHEREYSAKYKEYENDISEINKNFKNKKSEIVRKLDYDIKKENEQSLRSSSPLDKELLVVNEPIQIKTISNEIKKIRRENLEKIYQLTKESFEELENLETSYQTNLITKEKEIKIFREQLNVKIAHLNEKISLIKQEEQRKEEIYQLDFEKVLLETSRDNYLKLNELKKDYLSDVVNLKKLILEKNFLNELNVLAIITDNYNEIKDKVSLENEEVHNFNNEFYDLEIKQINNLTSFLTSQIEFLLDLVNQFISEEMKTFDLKNEYYFSSILLNNIPKYQWENYDYQFNYERFKVNIAEHKQNRQKRYLRFEKEYKTHIKNISNLIESLIKHITSYIEQEIGADKVFFEKLHFHNDESLLMASEVYQSKKVNLSAKYANEIASLDAELEKIILDYENEKRVILADFDNDILKHNNKIKSVETNFETQNKNINEHLKNTLREINNKIRKINEETKNKVQEATKQIKEKYNKKHLENLNEKKEKIKLL